MKAFRGIIPLLLMLLTIEVSVAQQTKTALFLGNSYTYVNDLPQLIKDIAISKGDTLISDQNTPGGYTFQGHSTNTTSISKINSRNWDYVVLQEQSQKPSFSPSQVASDVLPYAKTLDGLIKSNDSCSQTMFYMTWGRKYGDASNCGFYPPICTYLGMQERLRDSYVLMAVDNDASVAPVGMAWKYAIAADTNLNLYQADESHPNLFGSYLAACVFYSSIFHKSSVGANFPVGIPTFQAVILQTIADQTVFDSLATWRIDTADLKGSFTSSNNGMKQYSFNASSNKPNTQFLWTIEGSTVTGQSVNHTFIGSGMQTVILKVIEGCDTVLVEEMLDVPVGIHEIQGLSQLNISVSPNPFNQIVKISLEGESKIDRLSIIDLQGRTVFSNEFSQESEFSIDLSDLNQGLYILQVVSGDQVGLQRIEKN